MKNKNVSEGESELSTSDVESASVSSSHANDTDRETRQERDIETRGVGGELFARRVIHTIDIFVRSLYIKHYLYILHDIHSRKSIMEIRARLQCTGRKVALLSMFMCGCARARVVSAVSAYYISMMWLCP